MKIRKGAPSSIASTIKVDACWHPRGSLSAYQATMVGKGCVQKWKSSALKLRQVGSWLANFTKPDRKYRRNASQRYSHAMVFCVVMVWPKKIARNPTSSSKASHWKDRNSWPARLNERYSTYSSTKASRSSRPMNKMAPSPTPIHAVPAKILSDEFHQNTLGAAQKRIQPRLAPT